MSLRDIKPALALSEELRDLLEEEARMVDLIRPYIKDRKEEAGSKARKEQKAKKLRAYFEANPGKVLKDDFGNTAELRNVAHSRQPDTYDVHAMPDELVLKLARAKALEVDRDMLKALEGKDILAVDVKRYLIPGGTTTRLNIEEAG